METILVALIVACSTLGGVVLGTRLIQPRQPTLKQEPKGLEDVVKELYNLKDEKEKKNFEDLTKALSWTGENDE